MNQVSFSIEALKLLGEIEAFADYHQVNNIEDYFQQYKMLLNSHQNFIPSRTMNNLPFIAMGIQMAKIKNREESKIRHIRTTCKWLKADLEYLLNAVELSSQAA